MARAIEPLSYDPCGAFLPGGITPADARALPLADVRSALLASPVPAGDDSTGDIGLADRIIADYRAHRGQSELGRVLAAARRLADEVDRVVVLTAGSSRLGIAALLATCCHPYHNELSRAQRGGQPRIYLAGHDLDNDRLAGLFDLLAESPFQAGVPSGWAIVAIDGPGDGLNADVAQLFVDRLAAASGGDRGRLARLVVAVAEPASWLCRLAKKLDCAEMFALTPGGAGPGGVLGVPGLLPAAVLGLDVRRLIEGAARMNAHFRSAPAGENRVLQYAGVCHLLTAGPGMGAGQWVVWAAGLESLLPWQAQLQAAEREPCTLSAAEEQEKQLLITNLLVDGARRDRLALGPAGAENSPNGNLPPRRVPDLLRESFAAEKRRALAAGRPSHDIHLPRLDEPALGQLFQMLLLAAKVECRLRGNFT